MRVVVAEDQLLTRAGIVRVLEDAGVSVVGEADTLAGLLRLVALELPDVAIVDIRMPPNYLDEGIIAAESIRADHPGTGVLILSQHVELNWSDLCWRAGPASATCSRIAYWTSTRWCRPFDAYTPETP